MDTRKQLYYLLEHYLKEEYTTKDFVDEFSRIYDLEVDGKLLSEIECIQLREMTETAHRFSPFVEDLEKTHGFYVDETVVKAKAKDVFEKLMKGYIK